MRYLCYKDLIDSVSKLYEKSGVYLKAAQKVAQAMGNIDLYNGIDPLREIKITDHGESRIKHCIKRDLGHGCRLITIIDNNMTILCYAGTHDDCDVWLDRNRGLELTINDKNELVEIHTSTDITDDQKRIYTKSGLSSQLLINKISARHIDRITKGINWSLLQKFTELKSTSTEDEILELSVRIDDLTQQSTLFDVFCKLREDDVEGATKSIELYTRELQRVEEVQPINMDDIKLSDNFIDYDDLEPELFEHYVKTVNFKKWMLFMHPDQRKIVEKNFNGPAKLVGVSGSGKTAIVVKRAAYLAKEYPDEKILVLTLNRALASLIEDLIDVACPDEACRKRIDVYSFWKLCQMKLFEYEPQNEKLYDDLTWKIQEHVDEIWKEYFECKMNNDDARVLTPINRSLLSRYVYPNDYMRQEFDWIRSCCPKKSRSNYLALERQGRTEPFTKDFREIILKGLEAWEEKMEFVGVVDYLGLSTALHKHLEKIRPEYRCVLVDEVQDFGTIELEIIKRLVPDKENNIFLCGDIAQQVYFKHHKLSDAGINIIGRSHSIKKNYRNSKEILQAAYCLLSKNIDLGSLKNDDFEVLEPDYANFSTPRPLLLKCETLQEEIGYCLNYLRNNSENGKKACIAMCGYTLFDVKSIGQLLGIPVLDGDTNLDNDDIFLSDLEQTKGFEFDMVCILNCNEGIIPSAILPQGEWYKEISKFYVAMTRAKLSLMISYSTKMASMLEGCRNYFVEAKWSEHEEKSAIEGFSLSMPMATQDENLDRVLEMTGDEFLFTKKAVGVSLELSAKLSALIDGRGASLNGRKVRWQNIGDAIKERDIPAIAQQLGAQKTWPEFKMLFNIRHIE